MFALLLLSCSPPAYASELSGRASVIDGDTIEIHGQRIRLWGVDAPESVQLCRGSDSDLYRCGARAANEIAGFLDGKVVTCEPVDTDRYGRTVARCLTGGADLGEWLVARGLALDWPRYSHGRHASAQAEARHAERGVWSGSFVEPWLYRACVHAGGRPAICSDDAPAF
jgi:endonuclease YncB( thermonuclease family)